MSVPEPVGPGGRLSTRRTPSGVVALAFAFEFGFEFVLGLPGVPEVTAALDKGLVQLPPRCTNSCQPDKG